MYKRRAAGPLLILVNPFAPHITEEMWQISGFEGMLNEAKWPEYEEAKTIDTEIEVAVQINGKTRDKLKVPVGRSKEDLEKFALESEKTKNLTQGKQVVESIVVPDKLVNLVVK